MYCRHQISLFYISLWSFLIVKRGEFAFQKVVTSGICLQPQNFIASFGVGNLIHKQFMTGNLGFTEKRKRFKTYLNSLKRPKKMLGSICSILLIILKLLSYI